jgi:hypothetical protein
MLGQTLAVIIRGRYDWGGHYEEVQFQQAYRQAVTAENIPEPLQTAYGVLNKLAYCRGIGMPQLSWLEQAPREDVVIEVEKLGRTFRIVHSGMAQTRLSFDHFTTLSRVVHPGDGCLIFGTSIRILLTMGRNAERDDAQSDVHDSAAA